VASSRSASAALPNEQNQPGRRLAQAVHPAGPAICFNRAGVPREFLALAMALPRSPAHDCSAADTGPGGPIPTIPEGAALEEPARTEPTGANR
jgi:hypothetical protein